MSEGRNKAFDYVKDNATATAAALELVLAASGVGHAALDWTVEGDNLKKLRDKIKECAEDAS